MSESFTDPKNTTSGTNNKALGVLFLAVFVDLLGFGLIIPILPFWVKGGLGESELMYGFLIATFSIFQFIFAPIWGRISDNIGRRPVILTGLVGTVIGFSTLTIAAIVADSLLLIFLARAISGIFTAATLPTSQAFISDSTSGKDRAKGFGLMGAAFGLGFAFGPAIGGISFVVGQALGGTGYVLPTLVAVGFAVVNLLVAIRNIPETLSRQKIEERKQAKIQAGKTSRFEVFSVVLSTKVILLIILIFTILNLSFSAMEATFALFGEVRFGLNEAGASIILLIVGITAIFTQGGLVRPLSSKYPDAILIVSGYIILTVAFLGLITT
ncbi:MAG: MFS transporter, partial [Candidatus Hodarchaeales archaeon]